MGTLVSDAKSLDNTHCYNSILSATPEIKVILLTPHNITNHIPNTVLPTGKMFQLSVALLNESQSNAASEPRNYARHCDYK